MPVNLSKYQRQVHLDFHTSPFIPDVGCEFDATEFARTVKRAHINSITIFAKCHHGQCYYPTKTGVQHPALNGRDLMGEQIEALHREGIRCPIYTTVAWEEDVAQKHPEWRQMTKNGSFAGWPLPSNPADAPIGAWKFANFLHPDYQDYIEAHVREICAGYDVDGLFFDILIFAPNGCWSDSSVKFRERHGLLGTDAETYERFQAAGQIAFAKKFTKLVHGLKPEATVFYNAQNEGNIDTTVGPRSRFDHVTHYEIESLPSGFWGYHHFPRMARLQSHWGKFWLGMTGRFQKMWGDFGGIKPQAALEYECFRAQALGGGNSVGDQLPPRGTLDPAAYELIGAVFQQCEEAEPFYEGSEALPQIGILSASFPGLNGGTTGKSEEGSVQMCEETHYDAAVCDSQSDLSHFDLVILPDSTVMVPELKKKLAAYYASGGKLILSHRSGFDRDGKWALDFLPLEFSGEEEKSPTYWRARKEFDASLHRSDRVFYQPGLNVRGREGTRILIDRVLPYFKRTDVTFSSHFQTPPVTDVGEFPAVVAGERFVYFADPIFREYRQAGNVAAREVWKKCVHQFIGVPPFGRGLPGTVLVCPRRRGDTLLLTILHYIPVRKSLDIDIIDEPSSLTSELLTLPEKAESARIFKGPELQRDKSGAFILPASRGRLLVEVPGFF